jgi:hypothetical protein
MSEQRSKQQVIAEIQNSGNPATKAMFMELIDCYMQEARVENDEAVDNVIYINQGKIQLCKYMKAELTAGKNG